MKIFIFGDSFSEHTTADNSWISLLEKKYNVINFSKGGLSNADILNLFLKNINLISSSDYVIYGWTDCARYHININVKDRFKSGTQYLEEFYCEEIHAMHYRMYIKNVQDIVKDKNLKMLTFYSFPSINFNNEKVWDYQILPDLCSISAREVNGDYKKSKFYPIDSRPNHLGDFVIHHKLFNIVEEFIKTPDKKEFIIT